MKPLESPGCAILVTGLLLSMAAQANRYTIVDLGPLEEPAAINDKGMVTGNTTGRPSRGTFYRGGRWHKLAYESRVTGMDAQGDIVGEIISNHPYLWEPHRPAFQLPMPNGATDGSPEGINDQQVISGWYITGGGHGCFLWSPSGGATDLGRPQGDRDCEGEAINNDGQVAGRSGSIAFGGTMHAFFYDHGTFTHLPEPAGTSESWALALNSAGIVIGKSYDGAHWHACSWIASQLHDLDPAKSYADSWAAAINDAGEIVGTVRGTGTDSAVRFAHSKVIPLSSEVDHLGDWRLHQATGIDTSGAIVGQGWRHADNQEHAFMLVPTERSSSHDTGPSDVR